MVTLQIISKVIATQDISIIKDNLLSKEYFPEYEEEYDFIMNHYEKYGNVPDASTFLAHFNNGDDGDIELVEVTESDQYLLDTIREEYLYAQSVPVVQRIAELLKTDANAAAEYMVTQVKHLQPNYELAGVNIIQQADERYQQFVDRKEHQSNWFFTTGFPELDDLIHGIQRNEEYIVIVARTNEGKSWILEKICTHIWEIGFNVGYISPEMGANSVGYRFDTLHSNISNRGLVWGKEDIDNKEYEDYIEKLKERNNQFIVSKPKDFDRKITVSKLRNWITKYRLDVVAIDGITYMSDERYIRGDSKTTSLTNISEDLMELSIEMNVPILVVVQANRGGIATEEDDDSVPELEHIRDSDGIAFNASKVLSIRQLKNQVLVMQVKKQRNGAVGGKLSYQWDIDKGEFVYIATYEDARPRKEKEKQVRENKKKFSNDKTDVF